MRPRDLSLTIALCASLVAHGILALATFEGARRQLAAIRLPGNPRDLIQVDTTPDAVRLGGLVDEGLAPNASPGDDGLRARRAPVDQALLSRDPRGPGRIGDLPSDSLVPPTDGPTVDGTAGDVARGAAVLAAPTDAAQPFGAGPDAVAALVVPRPARPVPVAPTPTPPEQQQARSSKPAADPAMQSDSESDAFSTLGGVEFRDGRIESRMGRAFKSVRPRLDLAARIELMSLSEKKIVLTVSIDATGKVRSVDVLRSTGRDVIDQPVKLVLYEWWFEPPKDAQGHARADTFVLPITWP
jgi:TonB family protein